MRRRNLYRGAARDAHAESTLWRDMREMFEQFVRGRRKNPGRRCAAPSLRSRRVVRVLVIGERFSLGWGFGRGMLKGRRSISTPFSVEVGAGVGSGRSGHEDGGQHEQQRPANPGGELLNGPAKPVTHKSYAL